ncbi:hypothetical protein GGP44_003269 [Salinibacter ruber]|nr:hypothetical protein [Salinibacter ruber]
MKRGAVEDFRAQMPRARIPQAQNQMQSRIKRRNGQTQEWLASEGLRPEAREL